MSSEIPGGKAEADAAAQTQHSEAQKHENASDQFQSPTHGAQRIYEKLPADATDGGKLFAHAGTEI